MEASKIPLLKWVWAIYLDCTSLKGVSAMKLHRDLGIGYKAAWFLQHRIREAFAAEGPVVFAGPVEIDETFVGGEAKSMHVAQKKKLKEKHGSISAAKAMVVGAKDRETGRVVARVIDKTDVTTLHGFIEAHTDPRTMVYTDGATVYKFLFHHESVNHSAGEYVRGMVHTQGVEIVLVDAEAGPQGRLPSDVGDGIFSDMSTNSLGGITSGTRTPSTDAACRGADGREAADLQGADR